MKSLFWLAVWAVLGIFQTRGQTVEVLHLFTNPPPGGGAFGGGTNADGAGLEGRLAFTGSTLYGTTLGGGAQGGGTIFSMGLEGDSFEKLFDLPGISDSVGFGAGPLLPLDGVLWGLTQGFDSYSSSLYSLPAAGATPTVWHTFANTNLAPDGANPSGRLTHQNGILYGSTLFGGPNDAGIIFSQTLGTVAFTPLHAFSTNAPNGSGIRTNDDGYQPLGSLAADSSHLYGTAKYGGVAGGGTVYSLRLDGSEFTTLHHFGSDQGDYGQASSGVILDNGHLYGVTDQEVYSLNVDGTGFRVLHAFTGGEAAAGELTLVGSTLLGTTAYSSTGLGGEIFSVKTDGSGFTIIYTFPAPSTSPGSAVAVNATGSGPGGGLIFAGGRILGACNAGGPGGGGTVFAIADPPWPASMRGVSFDAGGNPVIQCNGGRPTGTYTLQFAASLADPVTWQDAVSTQADSSGTLRFSDLTAAGQTARFYRVVAQ